jgi:hypothetical protein
MADASGNVEAETMINSRTEYKATYKYEGTSLATDLSTYLTEFGNVVTGFSNTNIAVTEMSVRFEAGQYPTIDMTGHVHTANPHEAGTAAGYINCQSCIASSAGFGIPTWSGQTIGANATPSSASVTISFNHVDKIAQNGTHFAGKNIRGQATMTESFIGLPTTPTPTGWTADSYSTSVADSNEDFDTSEWSGHRYYDLAT